MPLNKVRRETSSSEFYLWMAYLDWEVNAFNADRQYFAQIALEACRSRLKEPNKVSLKDFLLKFEVAEKPEVNEESVDEANGNDVNKVKAFFFALTGLSGNSKASKKRELPAHVQPGPWKPVSAPGPKHDGVRPANRGGLRKGPTSKR